MSGPAFSRGLATELDRLAEAAGVAARLAARHEARMAAEELSAEYPAAVVGLSRLRDGSDGLAATVRRGDGSESVIGPAEEVAGWLAGKHQDPAVAVPPVTATAGPAGDSSPGESPAGGGG